MSHLLINLSLLLAQPTGITTYAANIYPYLNQLDPTLLIAQPQPNFKNYQVPSNLTPAEGTKGHLRRLLWTQFQLPKIYRELSASLLFSPVPEAPLFQNCRTVVMVHDLIPVRFPKRFSPLTPYFKSYIPQVLQKSLHIVCNSQATANDIVNFWGITAEKITPILLAYDTQHFFPRPSQTEKRQTIPYFLYLGRQDPYKNLSRLITAFAQLSSDVELWIAGPSDQRYTPQLQEQAKTLGISHQVKFLDYVSYENLPILLSQALALVFPTLWEGFGLPVIEAMACGTPVITSNLASLPEITNDSAILIDPYSVDEIKDAMQQILTDGTLRSQLRQKGLQRASQFSWQKTAHQTREILEQFV
ncbi:MAG: glycosyltransferase family 4 protein [Microcystaceae cyanobacterium]